jgi:hypothetical protein
MSQLITGDLYSCSLLFVYDSDWKKLNQVVKNSFRSPSNSYLSYEAVDKDAGD